MQLAQMQAQSKQDLAVLAATLKGPSAAVLKAQEKAEKAAEGKEVLSDTLETAKTLVNDLYKLGGMTSTSKQPLANLVTSLQTGTVGQIAGQAFGTKTQAKRDEIKSIRLQLLNAIKEATGMSAQQLNSNVELKTYLDSLGSEKMTKEANLAIIENISTRYLKGQAAKPEKDKSDPLGIR
jgi:Cu/Ag efflux pump CusA